MPVSVALPLLRPFDEAIAPGFHARLEHHEIKLRALRRGAAVRDAVPPYGLIKAFE
jgi:hypothetical protein